MERFIHLAARAGVRPSAIHKFARLMQRGDAVPMFGDGSTEHLRGRHASGLQHPDTFEIVNLGESRTVPLSELIDTIARNLGVTPEIERLPMQPGDMIRTDQPEKDFAPAKPGKST